MKYQILFSGKRTKKNVVKLSSVELAERVVKVKDIPYYIYMSILLQLFSSNFVKPKRTVW